MELGSGIVVILGGAVIGATINAFFSDKYAHVFWLLGALTGMLAIVSTM